MLQMDGRTHKHQQSFKNIFPKDYYMHRFHIQERSMIQLWSHIPSLIRHHLTCVADSSLLFARLDLSSDLSRSSSRSVIFLLRLATSFSASSLCLVSSWSCLPRFSDSSLYFSSSSLDCCIFCFKMSRRPAPA